MKRFDMIQRDEGYPTEMVERDDGDFVLHSDHSLAIAAAVQAEREACAQLVETTDSIVRPHIARLIRSRPSPAVDVIGVVRRFLSITDQPGHSIDAQRAAWNELRSLVDGAAAKPSDMIGGDA